MAKEFLEIERLTLFEFDKGFNNSLLCGVDEAGRGPLAGDVYAAAVILPVGCEIEGLGDSKKLSHKKREQLFSVITEKAVAFCIATATVEEIERINILNAAMLAMHRAVDGLSVTPSLVLVDGNRIPKWDYDSRDIVKGDDTSACIAAASILAKVARDRYMAELDNEYPLYQFSKHKGYGTKLHYEAIKAHGILPIHRKTFLKKLTDDTPDQATTRSKGQSGEDLAARYLIKRGYIIVSRNFVGKSGEIDIIACKDNTIAFVEVKLRTTDLVLPQDSVTHSKRVKLQKTADEFVTQYGYKQCSTFDIVEVLIKDKKTLIRHIPNAFDMSKP